MESPVTVPVNGQVPVSSSTSNASVLLSSHPQDFIPMSSHFQIRHSIRSAATTGLSGSPIAFAVPAAHARAADALRMRTSIPPIPNVAEASSTNGTFSRTRKRKHHEAENPEGSETSSHPGLISTSAPKRRRVNCSPPKRRARTPKKTIPKKTITSNLKAPPPSTKKSIEDEHGDKKPAAKAETSENCCICMCDVESDDLSQINGCEHRFCFGCIEKWAERENTCPLCKCRFTKIDRVNKKRKKGVKNSKSVRQRDQRSDLLPGAAIEGLLTSLSATRGGAASAGLARIIFGVTGSAPGPFGTNVVGTATNQAMSLVDSDDEYSPMGGYEHSAFNFFQSLSPTGPAFSTGFRLAAYSSSISSLPSASFSIRYASSRMVPPPPPPVRARSHATNRNDPNAGSRLENPLEIASDSEDDAVEVVELD